VKYRVDAFPNLAAASAASVDHAAAARSLVGGLSAQLGVPMTHVRTAFNGSEVVKLEGRRSEAELQALIRQIRNADSRIEYVEPDRMMHALMTPNDTRYNEQWDLYESTAGINMPTAWNSATGSGVTIAIIDTGYRPHADLAANVVGGYDFISDTSVSNDGDGRDSDASDPGDWTAANQCASGDPAYNSSWHGTHVSGTAAAVTNNATGVAGIAYNAKLLEARVLGTCGGYTSDIADAIAWSSGGSVSGVPANAHPAKVLSLSLGGSGSCDSTTQSAINTARANGASVVVAAGNENQNASNSSPANCSGVIAVASVGRSGGKAYYSNYGSIVALAAPGGDQSTGTANGILSTLNAGTTTPGADSYGFYQGTSQATPHVSAAAALLYSVKPTITPDQVKSALTSTARAFPATCSQCGAGILDAAAAVSYVLNGGGGGGGGGTLQNGVPVTGLAGSTGQDLVYTLAVPSGASNLGISISGGSGDADLYVKFGSQPTLSSYDCRPYLNGNNESCSFAAPQTGTYYVMLHGYAAFSGVTLSGSYSSGGGSGSCPSGYTQYTGSLSSAGTSSYKPSSSGFVPGAAGMLSAQLTGPAGADFDLYLQRQSSSGSWSAVASSTSDTPNESISYASGSTAYHYRWRVYDYSGGGSFTLCTRSP
jgi:serine protease